MKSSSGIIQDFDKDYDEDYDKDHGEGPACRSFSLSYGDSTCSSAMSTVPLPISENTVWETRLRFPVAAALA